MIIIVLLVITVFIHVLGILCLQYSAYRSRFIEHPGAQEISYETIIQCYNITLAIQPQIIIKSVNHLELRCESIYGNDLTDVIRFDSFGVTFFVKEKLNPNLKRNQSFVPDSFIGFIKLHKFMLNQVELCKHDELCSNSLQNYISKRIDQITNNKEKI